MMAVERPRPWPECLKRRAPWSLFAEMVDAEEGTRRPAAGGRACIAELIAWFERNGVWYDRRSCRIQARGGGDGARVRSIGLVATRRIAVGGVIARMDKSCMLTTRSAEVPRWLRERIDEHGLHGSANGLALTLMHERMLEESRGPSASRWAAYLRCMPHAAPIAPLFSDAQMDALRGTDAHRACLRLRARIVGEWERCARDIATEAFRSMRPAPRLLPPEREAPLDALLFREYVYSVSLVTSRAFSVDHWLGMGMVPFADLLDHDQHEHVHFTGLNSDSCICIACGRVVAPDEADEDGPLCRACAAGGAPAGETERDAIVFEVVREVAGAASEIFNTYGACDNSRLLCFYGFCLPPGRNDNRNAVSLSLNHVLRAFRDVQPAAGERDVRRLLRTAARAGVAGAGAGDDDEEQYAVRMHRRAPLSARLLRLLLILATGRDDHVEEVVVGTESEEEEDDDEEEDGDGPDALRFEKELHGALPRAAVGVALRALALRADDLAPGAADCEGLRERSFRRDMERLRALRKRSGEDAGSESEFFIACVRVDEWRCLRSAARFLEGLYRRAGHA